MADRHVLLIDADQAFADVVRSSLAPYGIAVDVTEDGNEGLQRAKDYGPEILIISVELPDKAGYATCNKAKRGALNHLPVILASRTVPWADLEQHRKLRYRADDYLDKRRAGPSDILQAVGALVTLGAPAGGGAASRAPSQLDVDVDVDLDGDAETTSMVDLSSEVSVEESTAGSKLPVTFDSEDIDRETEAAFGALFEDTPAPNTDPQPRTRPLGYEPPPTNLSPARGVAAFADMQTSPSIRQPDLAPPEADEMDTPQPDTKLTPAGVLGETEQTPVYPAPVLAANLPPAPTPPGPTTVVSPPPIAPPTPAPVAAPPPKPAAAPSMASRLNELEHENARLKKDLDEVKKAPPVQAVTGGSTGREFTNLREVINRKEKETLELKEQLDARERQLVGAQDKAKDLERRVGELEAARKAAEGQLREAQEGHSALGLDKERAAERERGLKSRLESAQLEIKKAHEDYDSLKKRLAAAEETAAADVAKTEERLRRESAGRISQLEADHALALSRATEAHRAELATLEARIEEERGAAIAAADVGRNEEVERLRREHAATLERLEGQRTVERGELVAAHEEALGKKDRERKEALERAREEREAMLTAAEEQRQADLAELEERRSVEVADLTRRADEARDAAEARHAQALAEVRRGADEVMAELRRANESALADAVRVRQEEAKAAADAAAAARKAADEELQVIAEQHRHKIEADAREAETRLKAEVDKAAEAAAKAADAIARLEEAKAAVEKDLATAREKAASLETDLSRANSVIRTMEKATEGYQRDVEQAQKRITELETARETVEKQLLETQEQVLKAHQRIKTDESTVDRAKKAMAVALTILDQPTPNGAGPGTKG